MSRVLGKPGMLYIVATPIGNLADITDRAKLTLSEVDLIAAEDTRHSGQLLRTLGIHKPLISLHEHNEAALCDRLIQRIKNGEKIALISDAGTPLISDPGYKLVDLAHQYQIKVVPIPGVSAVMAAISVAGISTADYRFIGFLPAKTRQRQARLNKLVNDPSTLVLFESPHRILATLTDCVTILGSQRLACYCRELTKKFETIQRATLAEIQQFVDADENQQRGEIVLVISGNSSNSEQTEQFDYQNLLKSMLDHMSVKDAAAILAKTTGQSRKYFYEMGVELKNN